jgi:hypothetical protein
LWNKRPDDISLKKSHEDKVGIAYHLGIQENVGCYGSVYRERQTDGRGTVRLPQIGSQ